MKSNVGRRSTVTSVAFLLLWVLAAPSAAGPSETIELKLEAFDPLVGLPELPAGLRTDPAGPEEGPAVHIVQLNGPLRPAWAGTLDAIGAVRLGFVPDNAFAVRIDTSRLGELRSLPFVRWVGPFEPGYKISPDIGERPFADPSRRAEPFYRLTVDLWPGEDPLAAADLLRAAGAEILKIEPGPYPLRIEVRTARDGVDALAVIPAVQWIEEIAEITMRNTTTPWVVQTNVQDDYSIWDKGLHGEGQVIGHIDGRIDMDSCYFRDPVNNTPGPGHRKIIAYRSNSGLGKDSHGTHTAGTAAGDRTPIDGSTFANGNAWAAKISHTNLNDISGSGSAPSNLYDNLVAAHSDGARVHTNSWGDDGTTLYTTWSRDIDQFSYDREESVVMFAVTNLSTLRTPENAKNCVGVGASGRSPNQHTHCSGGRGPTNDGRRKPEVYTPGCSIISARFLNTCGTSSSTGTSMASPSTTAGAALIRQYYTEGWYPSGLKTPADALTPSGALLRATLINSAVDMTGVSGYPSDREGWGRALLENALYFSGDARRLALLADIRNADGLATGQEQSFNLEVSSSSEPLKITLAFTEPPAALFANPATVNDLDLEVTDPGGTLYLGNVFDTATGFSVTGGAADAKNNLEQIHLASPAVGTWQVKIRGKAVNEATQGFALVASGDVVAAVGPALRHDGHTIQDSAPFGNADGVLDPGETATVPVTLFNSGTDDATGISARASSNLPNKLKITTASASFADIPKGTSGSSNAPHYEVSLAPDVACGSDLQLRLDWSSSESEGFSSFPLSVGLDRNDYPALDVPLGIPKKTSPSVASTINIADAFTIADATVSLTLTHGNVGQLTVALTSPAGTSVTLHNKSRAGEADIDTTYDTLTPPDGPGSMDDFNGEASAGNWTLTITDTTAGPVGPGQLASWTLHLVATAPFQCSPLTCGDPVPGVVGATLILTATGSDILHDWDPLANVSDYRLWRSDNPDFSVEDSVATITGDSQYLETGALLDLTTTFYQVRGLNSCNQEGP